MTNYQSIVDNSDRASSVSSYRANSEFGSALDYYRPLLTNDTEDISICHTVYPTDEPSATITSCSINLANTILGTGMLAMVYIYIYIIMITIIKRTCPLISYLYAYAYLYIARRISIYWLNTRYYLDFICWMYLSTRTLLSLSMCS